MAALICESLPSRKQEITRELAILKKILYLHNRTKARYGFIYSDYHAGTVRICLLGYGQGACNYH